MNPTPIPKSLFKRPLFYVGVVLAYLTTSFVYNLFFLYSTPPNTAVAIWEGRSDAGVPTKMTLIMRVREIADHPDVLKVESGGMVYLHQGKWQSSQHAFIGTLSPYGDAGEKLFYLAEGVSFYSPILRMADSAQWRFAANTVTAPSMTVKWLKPGWSKL